MKPSIKNQIELLHKQVIENPNDATAHSDLAEIYWSLSKWEKAQTHAEIALNLDPNLSRPYWIIAACMISRGSEDNEKIKTFGEKGYQLSTNELEPMVVYSMICMKMNEFEKGFTILKNVLSLYPDNWWVRVNLFHAYQICGDTRNALQEIRKVYKLHPSVTILLFYYGAIVSSKNGKTIYYILATLSIISVILSIWFRISLLLVFPIIWYSQLIVVGLFAFRRTRKIGWSGIVMGVIFEIICFGVALWIFLHP